MKVPLLDLKGQYSNIREEVRRVIDEVCDSQYFILGPKVETFEKNTAGYCGARHAVGVSSGTDALLIALMALDIKPGDAVITTPYSFFATVGSIVRAGATPVFADIDPVTFNIDPVKVREIIRNPPQRFKKLKIKAMIPVHLYGQAADMDPLMDIAKEYGLKVIEDAAQAIGSEYPSKKGTVRAGAIGDMGCFSFFPSKNLGGFGDGGLVTTNNQSLAEKLVKLRNHGSHPKYYHSLIGGNFRLDALQAAVLNVKLKYLESWHESRRTNAGRYDAALKGSHISTPKAVYAGRGIRNYHIYNQYVVRVKDRDDLINRMRAADIGCEIYYPVPLHLQECFKHFGYREGDFPESEKAARETLALSIYPELTSEMQEYVVKTLKGC
ncbi:MAG: DegT/DnrJ/EryC1/StrS family aminotransferase [Kiritimatiellae bacterium]|nr:DegT/DnrJ/EryC1/StrS family aminotransferase [Kiritimatiellia bacterium]MDD5521389.1 DegT/DnrJ/EryC1/StrS family aminotransferase [Kiritimatiellia bacterium]